LEAEVRKRPRHGDLGLADLATEESEELSDLTTTLQTICEGNVKHVRDPGAFYFGGDKNDEAAVEELRETLQKLKIVARAKVTENRVYSAAYHPETTKDLVFFGGESSLHQRIVLRLFKLSPSDKHGQLGIWDAQAPPVELADEDGQTTTQDKEGGKYWRLQLHWPATSKSSISCIKFDPINSHNVRSDIVVMVRLFLLNTWIVCPGLHKCL